MVIGMIRFNRERQRLLTMLAGCPDGCTYYVLTVIQHLPPPLLYRSVDDNLISVRYQTVAARGNGGAPMTIFRFYITEKGRKAITSGAGC